MSLLDAANLEISFHIHKEVFRVAGRIDLTLEKRETLVIAGGKRVRQVRLRHVRGGNPTAQC